MDKYRKPLRSITDELFDNDWSYEKREQVCIAYDEFMGSLPELVRRELFLMLI